MKKTFARLLVIILAFVLVFNVVACGNKDSDKSSSVDGTYYFYEDGNYDSANTLIISNGKVTKISVNGSAITGTFGTKITGTNIKITVKAVADRKEYVYELIGTVSNGVAHITEANKYIDGSLSDNDSVDWYFCKSGKVPSNDSDNTSGSDSGEKYAGVTNNTIYVGNTNPTDLSGLGRVGALFNYGINAAFWEYNQGGGFSGTYAGKAASGLNVALISYPDSASSTNSIANMRKLIEEDEVFAIVGNFGSYALDATVDLIKEAGVPMIYTATDSEKLAYDRATGADRCVFSVYPISSTEGSVLIKRAFAPVEEGGLGGTKVGVIYDNYSPSPALLEGIRKGANTLSENQKNNIVYVDYGYSAARRIRQSGCDVVILAQSSGCLNSISDLMQVGYTSQNVKILTSYINQSSLFDVTESSYTGSNTHFDPTYASIIDAIYTQGWIDIADDPVTGYKYTTNGGLFTAYKDYAASTGTPNIYNSGVYGFNREFWHVAETLYNFGTAYASEISSEYNAFSISSNSYALVGYLAGNLFCRGLDMLGNRQLTRSNFVDAMESRVIDLPLIDTVSYRDGQRLGIKSFTLIKLSAPSNSDDRTASTVVSPFTEF